MKVIKNYLYNLSYQILTIILPIITVSYVTRIFTSEDLGNYGFYNSIVSYFSLFAMLGIGIYGTKQIAAANDVSSTFWNIYAIKYISNFCLCNSDIKHPANERDNSVNTRYSSVYENAWYFMVVRRERGI